MPFVALQDCDYIYITSPYPGLVLILWKEENSVSSLFVIIEQHVALVVIHLSCQSFCLDIPTLVNVAFDFSLVIDASIPDWATEFTQVISKDKAFIAVYYGVNFTFFPAQADECRQLALNLRLRPFTFVDFKVDHWSQLAVQTTRLFEIFKLALG